MMLFESIEEKLFSEIEFANKDLMVHKNNVEKDMEPNKKETERRKNFNILIVDDEPDLLEVFAMHLEVEKFTIFTATSVKEALTIYNMNKINFVLSDIQMPGQTGVDLLETLRKANKKYPTIVMMTGYSEYSADELLQKGADDFLSKPFDTDKLIKYIYQKIEDESSKVA